MFCVTVAYPRKDDGYFDFAYYTEQHVPMVARLLGDNAIRTEVRKGVGTPDGSAPDFVCLASFWIKSMPEMLATLDEHGQVIMADILNYTDIQPLLQLDEVVAA